MDDLTRNPLGNVMCAGVQIKKAKNLRRGQQTLNFLSDEMNDVLHFLKISDIL